ncbi:MAG: phospholipase/carboxylesterase [Verrucomicrobia bacterium]|nr:phospholipase/carboxylesterase [Verrucomicrobiota bacterium]
MNPTHHHVFEPGTDPAAPPVLLLHGTGGDEYDLLPLGRKLSPGSALLSPRGNVSEHGANRFFARLAEGVFDPREVSQRTNELADFVAATARLYEIDPRQLIAIGFSNGANVAGAMLQLRPELFAGAVLLRAMVVLERPATPGSLEGRRVLIASGNQDPIIPNENAARLATLLRAGGAEVATHVSNAGHGLTAGDLTVAQKFLAAR